MKMPNGHRAIVDIKKLSEYCLNPDHPRGQHKARVFHAVLVLDAKDANELRDALLKAASGSDCIEGEKDQFGQRYLVDFEFSRFVSRATDIPHQDLN